MTSIVRPEPFSGLKETGRRWIFEPSIFGQKMEWALQDLDGKEIAYNGYARVVHIVPDPAEDKVVVVFPPNSGPEVPHAFFWALYPEYMDGGRAGALVGKMGPLGEHPLGDHKGLVIEVDMTPRLTLYRGDFE
jgi:hypothetical protein